MLAVAGAILVWSSLRSDDGVIEVPAAIASDCSRNVEAEVSEFLGSLRSPSTVSFRRNGCYSQAGSIRVTDRAGLTIEGNGATFRNSTPNDNDDIQSNWLFLRSDDVKISDVILIGNFDDPGPRTPGRGSVTSNAGISIYGGSRIEATDVVIRNVFGDGVTVATSWILDTTAPETPRDVRLSHITVEKAARHCVGIGQVIRFSLEDSILRDCYLDGVDAEKDLVTDEMSGLHFLRNTISDFFGIGIVVPIGGPRDNPVRDVQIKENDFPTPASAAACNQAIAIAGYEGQYFADVAIEGNQILAWRAGIKVSGAMSGVVRGNTIVRSRDARPNDCGEADDANVVVTESPNVLVEENAALSGVAVEAGPEARRGARRPD